MKFIKAIFWEFVQNLPLVASFVIAVWLWKHQQPVQSLFWVIIGGVTGALLIRYTESQIDGQMESERVTLVNMGMITSLMLFFTVYLGSDHRWSSWQMDLFLGSFAGALLAMVQAKAATTLPLRSALIHGLALSLSFPILLISIRLLAVHTLDVILTSSIGVTAVISLIISLVDYNYLLSSPPKDVKSVDGF